MSATRRLSAAARRSSGPADCGVRRSVPSRPNAPPTGRVAGCVPVPYRDVAALRDSDSRPCFADP